MSDGELPRIPTGTPGRSQINVLHLSQFYTSLNSSMLNSNQERGEFVDQFNGKTSSAAIMPGKSHAVSRTKVLDNTTVLAGIGSKPSESVQDSLEKNSPTLNSKTSYLKMQTTALSSDKQKKSLNCSPKSFIAEQHKVHSESPIYHNHFTSEDGKGRQGEAPSPSFQKVRTGDRNVEVVRWKKQEFPVEDAVGTRHDVIALSRWLNSMYSKIPACKAWPPSVSDEEMSTAFERFLSTFSKDIFLNSTHPECLDTIIKSAVDQQRHLPFEREEPEQQERSTPDEVLMPFRASIEVVDAVAGEIIRQISYDCAERAMLLDKVITQYKVVLREAWIMKQRAETEGISGLRKLIRQCEELLICESKARVVAECSNEHHVIKASANERKIQAYEKELAQSNVLLSRMRDQIDHCHRQLRDKDNDLECKALFLKDAKASIEVKQLHLENVLMRERHWEEKVRAMGADPNCFLGIDAEVQVNQESFQEEVTGIERLVTPPELRKARLERDSFAKSIAQMKKSENTSLNMKDLQAKKVQPQVGFGPTIVTQSIEDTKSKREKEVLSQKLKENDARQLSLLNQSQQQLESYKILQDQLASSRQEIDVLKESLKSLESNLAESETQRKKSEADVLILLEETDALQKKQTGSLEDSMKIEEVIREAKANVFKEQLLVKKLQEELESWKENELRLSRECTASKETAAKQRTEIQNLNSKLIVLERDFSLISIELKNKQQAFDEKILSMVAKQDVADPVVIHPHVEHLDIACQTNFVENKSSSNSSPEKQKKAVKLTETVVASPTPVVVDEGLTHEKIKKATLQLRADLKKKNEETHALLDKIKDIEEKTTMQRASIEEKSTIIAKLHNEKKELFDKNLVLQSQLEIACRPPAPTEKVADAVAALQVIGALTQMHNNSNQHEANEKLKRKYNILKEQEKPKLQLAQVLDKPKTPIAEAELPVIEKRKVKTPLLPAVVAQKIQVMDEASGDGDAEVHSENREQVLKILATAQGIGKATKVFRRQVKVSDDPTGEANSAMEIEIRFKDLEEKLEILTHSNETLRAGNLSKTEEICRLSFQVQKLKDELTVLADQRATWLKDEQKRIHLESSVQSAAHQTKTMMETLKTGTGAFKCVENVMNLNSSIRALSEKTDNLQPNATVSATSYVPKPEIPRAAIPYMRFLKDENLRTPRIPKTSDWLNRFFEDVMSCKVSSDRFDKQNNLYHDDVGEFVFAYLVIMMKSVPKAITALSVVHNCADSRRRESLKSDLVHGILAERYDSEQAAFYWWMQNQVSSGSLKIENDGTVKPQNALRFLKDIFVEQTKDWPKILISQDAVSFCSQKCITVDQLHDVALNEYSHQKSAFWNNLLNMHKIELDQPVSKMILQNVISFIHQTWSAGQVCDMLNELLQGQKEVSFLGFIQMFHSYHFFERKLALSRRGKIAVSERSVEVASIYQRKQELIELLAGSQISFSKLFEAKMSFPSIASTDSGKMPRNELVEEK